jgi:hypothetical protein
MAMGDDPVRRFCAELFDYVRESGLKRADVARRHPMSDSQVYAVLRGQVLTPPPFDRMVVPIIMACGADAERIAWWRARHAMMVREYELDQRRRKQDAAPATAPEPIVDEPVVDEPVVDRPADEPPADGSRRRLILSVALAVVAGVTALSLVVAWFITRPDGREALPAQPVCTAGPPEPGGDLLDVPHPTEGDGVRFDHWWSNTGKVTLGRFDLRSWTATVRDGAAEKPFGILVVRSCVPIDAGAGYRLSLRASATAAATISVRVQQRKDPDYPESLMKTIALTTEPQLFEWSFPGRVTSRDSEVTFQLGGNPDLDITITDITLTLDGP